MVQPGIIKNAMAKLSRPGVLFKRKNINNGSGVNNNNSNEEEKTKEMVLGLPPKRGQTLSKAVEETAAEAEVDLWKPLEWLVQNQMDLRALEADVADGGDGRGGGGDGSGDGEDGGGDNVGGDKTEGGGGGGGKMDTETEPEGQHDDYRNSYSYHGGDENGYPVGQLQRCYYQKPNVCSIIPYQRKNINNGSGDNNNNSNDGEKKTKEMVLDHPGKRHLRLNNFGDTVRTGADPMEPDIKRNHIELQQQQQRLQLLHQMMQQHQQQKSQQQQQLKLQLQQLQQQWPHEQQLLQRQHEQQRQQLMQQLKLLELSIKASGHGGSGGDGDGGSGGDSDGDGGSGGDSGDGNGSCDDGDGDNNGGGKTKGGGGDGGKMESKGQHDNRNRFSYHGVDENGYPVGQLHRCYYEKTNVYSVIPIQV